MTTRFSLHFGQHSPGILTCFERGHCKTGQAFFVHVKRLFEHEHFTQGSSLSCTSRPFDTICPFRWQPGRLNLNLTFNLIRGRLAIVLLEVYVSVRLWWLFHRSPLKSHDSKISEIKKKLLRSLELKKNRTLLSSPL